MLIVLSFSVLNSEWKSSDTTFGLIIVFIIAQIYLKESTSFSLIKWSECSHVQVQRPLQLVDL